jgi:hypothetical protein
MDAVAPAIAVGKPPACTTAAEILAWVQKARAGERLVYHVGHLAHDRMPVSFAPTEVGRIATIVRALIDEGRVIPLQQRRPDGQIAYLAVRSGVAPKEPLR